MIEKIKRFFFDWIVYILLGILGLFYIISLVEIFDKCQNLFFEISSIFILAYSFIKIFIDGFASYSIEENLHDDFKRGLDYNIDKIIDSLELRAKILVFLMIVWIIFFIYFIIEDYEKINIFKYLFVFLFPLIINGIMLKITYNIKKDFDS